MKLKGMHSYLSTSFIPKWTVLLIDLCIVVISFLIAYCLRFDLGSLFANIHLLGSRLFLVVAVNAIFLMMFRTSSGVLRYSSFVDILRLLLALSFSLVALFFINVIYLWNTDSYLFLDSFLIVDYLLNFVLFCCFRVMVKMYFEFRSKDEYRLVRVMIYCNGKNGSTIAKIVRSSRKAFYQICGFIADDADFIGKSIMGIKVYSSDDLLEGLANRKVDTLILDPVQMEQIDSTFIDTLLKHRIKLLTLSPVSEFKKENELIKEIQIDDLLLRKPIEVDVKKIGEELRGKCILITGAAGSIGSEIVRQVVSYAPSQLVLVDQAETPLHDVRLELNDHWKEVLAATIVADVSNRSRMEAIFKLYRPHYVFHAAGYKHVPMMENNVPESIQVNVAGTCNVADWAVKYGAEKFVLISTDEATTPTNVMGASKRIAEIYIHSLDRMLRAERKHPIAFITTRFGNVLDSNGSVIPRFKAQIAKGGPITVTHPNVVRYFMTTSEACRLILEAGMMGQGGEVYILDMGNPIKILELAYRMISLSGHVPGNDIKIEFTGLRHGEKLYEALPDLNMYTAPTHHSKIRTALVREYQFEEVNPLITKLIENSYQCNSMEIVMGMKQLVPEFVSKNSCFEKLDK